MSTNRTSHIRLTSHPGIGSASRFPIRWDAETARLWQSRQWRDCVDETVSADGELLRLNNAHRAAVFSR